MKMLKQRTLTQAVRATGVGLHSGEKVYMTLRPAPAGSGIVFVRPDKNLRIEATADAVKETLLSTTLVENGHRVATIEHLMSAVAGLGIDNLEIELSAAEVPIMDGSASPFVFLLQSAGITEQNAAKQVMRIKESVLVQDGDKWARVDPYDGFKMSFEIEFKHPVFAHGRQRTEMDFTATTFVREIARARTFGFMRDIEHMRSRNLALGGSLDNAVVLDEYRLLNADGLRYHDEFVRHKMLDAIGDIRLLGYNLVGAYSGFKSGHALNNALCRAVLAQPSAFEIVSLHETEAHTPAFGLANTHWLTA